MSRKLAANGGILPVTPPFFLVVLWVKWMHAVNLDASPTLISNIHQEVSWGGRNETLSFRRVSQAFVVTCGSRSNYVGTALARLFSSLRLCSQVRTGHKVAFMSRSPPEFAIKYSCNETEVGIHAERKIVEGASSHDLVAVSEETGRQAPPSFLASSMSARACAM